VSPELAVRGELLAEGNALAARVRAAEAARDRESARPARDRWWALLASYAQWLPEVTVARSPDSGALVRWPIDTVDVDGWFWDRKLPARRDPEPPAGWLTMTGALRLAGPPTPAPFTCTPGAEVPSVIPRILDQPGVRAVLAQVGVGPHTGWTVTYFGPRPPFALAGVWGTDRYPAAGPGGWGWAHEPAEGHQHDYELRPWIEAGKLLWIAPDDEAGVLHDGTGGCPYLDLPGRRSPCAIRDGVVRAAREG
jgi:hypothetical protein